MKRLCVALLLILLGISPGLANARSLLMVGGQGAYAHLEDEQVVSAFNGFLADYDPRISVEFPGDGKDFGGSMEVGTASLLEAIREHHAVGNTMTIGGVSQGAPAVEDVLRLLEADRKAGISVPSPDELAVFIYGPLGRDSFWWGSTTTGYTYQPPPETPYTVFVLLPEYDIVADVPDNLFNLLAVVNAIMGAEQRHVDAAFDPASDPRTIPLDYIWKETNSAGGTTWTIVIPATTLPILQPLVQQGWDPAFISSLDGLLRPIIDSAYTRNSLPNATERPTFPDTSIPSTPVPTEPPNGEASALKLNTEEATHATNGLPPVTIKPSDEADKELVTAREKATTGRPAGATDLTDGNSFAPGQTVTTNTTDQDTAVVEDAKEKEPPQISPANDGPTNDDKDADKAGDADPSASAANTGGDGSE